MTASNWGVQQKKEPHVAKIKQKIKKLRRPRQLKSLYGEKKKSTRRGLDGKKGWGNRKSSRTKLREGRLGVSYGKKK